MSRVWLIGIMVIVCSCLVSGQILLKIALGRARIENETENSLIHRTWLVISSKHFIGAMISLLVASLLWAYVLIHTELSIAYPLNALSFVLMVFAAHRFLGERITLLKVAGVIVICIGICILGLGSEARGDCRL